MQQISKTPYANMKLWVYDIEKDEVLLATNENTEGKAVYPALNLKNARRKADKIKLTFQKFKQQYEHAQQRLQEQSQHSLELLKAQRSDTGRGE